MNPACPSGPAAQAVQAAPSVRANGLMYSAYIISTEQSMAGMVMGCSVRQTSKAIARVVPRQGRRLRLYGPCVPFDHEVL